MAQESEPLYLWKDVHFIVPGATTLNAYLQIVNSYSMTKNASAATNVSTVAPIKQYHYRTIELKQIIPNVKIADPAQQYVQQQAVN